MSRLENEKLLSLLQEMMGDLIVNHHDFRGLLSVDIHGKDILTLVSCIHQDSRLNFPLLVDVSGVDYLEYDDEACLERFAVIYIFYSIVHDCRIKIRAFVPEVDPAIHSIYNEYKGADFTEREVYDMFGIRFIDHPNLKRILMPEDYGSNPLRKDYPLKGLGERSQFPKYNIYNKIEND
ncbi:MAG TPA: NADH-quinone oxidoreductase subunit C [Spirochaetes bacterium]|nr:NADH-quinone oxidoreductase subunit C [Spirochaetota bacterium]